MKHIVIRPAFALMMAGALLMGSAHAKTASTEAGGKHAVKKTGKKASHGHQVKFLPGGSAETGKERSARLQRECKGRVNAGACEGYTR